MDSVLENLRLLHEEKERLIDEMVKELTMKKKNIKSEINSGHRFNMHLERYMNCSKKLVELYEDKDGLMKEELSIMSGGNEFAEFYGRIRNVKEFHKKYPDYIDTLSSEFEGLRKIRERNFEEDNMVEFTDEECFGKFLDIDLLYQEFINLPLNRVNERFIKMTYLEYLSIVDRLYDLSFDTKNCQEYENYINNLKSYLLGFIKKAKPLLDIDLEINENLKIFHTQWSCGDFPGWNAVVFNNIIYHTTCKSQICQFIDFNKYDTVESLESIGSEEIKMILQKLGLKCGGTLRERAERLFLLKTKSIEDLDACYFPNKKKKLQDLNTDINYTNTKYKSMDEYKQLAFEEAQIFLFFDILKEELEATKDNVERKQARTIEEILREEDSVDINEPIQFEEKDFHDNTLYNPKNLPLDFDGKPIPYWLYKLHGLNIYYNCEICGNSKYRGPKAFQRHFGEWRHAHGMRTLGIPNTSHFVNITKIQDAYNLWDMIKNSKIKEQWNPDNDEEFEDSNGNPINKRIYDDLRRQGLL